MRTDDVHLDRPFVRELYVARICCKKTGGCRKYFTCAPVVLATVLKREMARCVFPNSRRSMDKQSLSTTGKLSAKPLPPAATAFRSWSFGRLQTSEVTTLIAGGPIMGRAPTPLPCCLPRYRTRNERRGELPLLDWLSSGVVAQRGQRASTPSLHQKTFTFLLLLL